MWGLDDYLNRSIENCLHILQHSHFSQMNQRGPRWILIFPVMDVQDGFRAPAEFSSCTRCNTWPRSVYAVLHPDTTREPLPFSSNEQFMLQTTSGQKAGKGSLMGQPVLWSQGPVRDDWPRSAAYLHEDL